MVGQAATAAAKIFPDCVIIYFKDSLKIFKVIIFVNPFTVLSTHIHRKLEIF